MDWTPGNRRSSAMRREQNLALIGAVVTGAVIAAGLIMLLFARVNPDGAARLRGVMIDLLTPVWSVVRAPFDGIGRAVALGSDYIGAVSRAERLEADLAAARAELQRAAADRLALAQLRRIAAVREPGRRLIVTARIVSATSGSMARTALVAAGAGSGVAPNLPVIGADGLIGRTVEVGRWSARVLLLTDPASRIPVTIVRTGQAALAVGTNGPRLELRDRVGPDLPLQAGDRLVTSGDGGVFPPGIPVGTIVTAAEPARIRAAATPVGAAYVRIEAAWLPLPVTPEPTLPENTTPVPAEARRSGARAPAATPATPIAR
jgi:rod shape-determining protein MreC